MGREHSWLSTKNGAKVQHELAGVQYSGASGVYPGLHLGDINLNKFSPVITYDIGKNNVAMQV